MARIHHAIYGHQIDGGPDAAYFRVIVSRARRALRRYSIPIEILTNKGSNRDGEMSGTHTLIFKEPRQ